MTRESFIATPIPIERELLLLFDPAEALTIFDIGACEGEDSIRYGHLFPNATIYAIEPLPGNVERIRAAVEKYGADAVHVLPFALSSQSGSALLHVSSGAPPDEPATEDWDYGNKSSSLLPPDQHLTVTPWVKFDTALTVQTRRLDEVCDEQRVERVDFLHMDVQGAELMVLQGAGRRLDTVRGIWLEVGAIPLYRDQPLKSDVEAFLISHDFVKVKDTVDAITGDQLWVRGGLRAPLGRRARAWARHLRRQREAVVQRVRRMARRFA